MVSELDEPFKSYDAHLLFLFYTFPPFSPYTHVKEAAPHALHCPRLSGQVFVYKDQNVHYKQNSSTLV